MTLRATNSAVEVNFAFPRKRILRLAQSEAGFAPTEGPFPCSFCARKGDRVFERHGFSRTVGDVETWGYVSRL